MLTEQQTLSQEACVTTKYPQKKQQSESLRNKAFMQPLKQAVPTGLLSSTLKTWGLKRNLSPETLFRGWVPVRTEKRKIQ